MRSSSSPIQDEEHSHLDAAQHQNVAIADLSPSLRSISSQRLCSGRPSTSTPVDHRQNVFGNIANVAPSLGLTVSFGAELDAHFGKEKESVPPRASVRGVFARFNSEFPFTAKNDKGGDDMVQPKLVRSRVKDAFSVPALRYRPFMKDPEKTRQTDLIVIYTNAMRHQSRGLYLILYCLNERISSLQPGDMKSFFAWFSPYHDFFCSFIAVVNDILLPSLRDLVPFRHRTPGFFATEGERLNRIVSKTYKSQSYFCDHLSLREATTKLCKIYASFAQPLLTYLSSVEEYSAVIISTFVHDDRAYHGVAVDMVRAFKAMPHFPRTIVLIMRWLEPRPQTTDRWLRQHLDVFSVLMYRWWKRDGPQEKTLYYFRIVSNSVLFY